YLEQNSDKELGQYFYHSKIQHPARLGAVIAEDYDKICEAVAHLKTKKLVVCDLDNTLWDGIIGEGEVRHFTERQQVLLRLKKKGVVLAIASKNDPNSVHWNGGTLSAQDFVYSHISWDPKITAFPKMQQILNLKMKDFVFIDDRADEREFVRSTYPDIQAMDATSTRSWDVIQLWETLLETEGAMDRTQLYLERADRHQFIDQQTDDQLSEEALFSTLDLTLAVRLAKKRDLKRVAELINRTNQFNMQASRTTMQEVEQWFASKAYRIYCASLSDKFGDMGIVSILITHETEHTIYIPAFVLSCRVFGYQVERFMLNTVKRLARKHNKSIEGQYVETMYNTPCKQVYENNGFIFDMATQTWHYHDVDIDIDDPAWLTIKSQV
ncbi:HAD-IIIC family phosphatase, partial [Gammaproteobacteria bacterium]|nr:HAD-IIIC family phosphatase [Gammaproteobacteria bacterium]